MPLRWRFPYDYPFGPNVNAGLNGAAFVLIGLAITIVTSFTIAIILGV